MRLRRGILGVLGAAAAVLAVRARPGARPLIAPAREPRALTRLADWCPPEPATGSGRALARAWAAPMTVAGLVAGATTRGRWSIAGDVLLVEGARGPLGRILDRRGYRATTLGHVVIAVGRPSAQLLAHERGHARQAERLGPLFAPVYVALLGVYGYRAHPLERGARRAAASVD